MESGHGARRLLCGRLGDILNEDIQLMKDSFNFISFTARLCPPPFPKTQTTCYPSALLSNYTASWRRSEATRYFRFSLATAVISRHHGGIYFSKFKIQRRQTAGKCQLHLIVAEHRAKGLIEVSSEAAEEDLGRIGGDGGMKG